MKYVDAGGVVREKDLTLKAVGTDGKLALSTSKAVAGYTTAANDIGLTLPTDPADGIRLTYEGAQVTLIPQGGTKGVVAQMADGAVTYPDFYGKGMSLRYTPSLSGVKEDIILRSYTGVNTFTFLLNTGGLGLYEENGRYYVAGSPDAETPIELGDLVTFDAHGRFSLGTTTAETLTPNQSYRLTLTVDEAFLTDENTVYPVTIDPSLTVSDNTHGSNAIEDATIYEGIPTLNTGSWLYHHVGIYDDEYGDGRTVFRLNGLLQSSIYQNLTADQITSVNFYVKEASGNADGIVYLFSMDSDAWTESGITWNNMVSFRGIPYATQTLRSGQTTGFNITDLVKEWKNGTRSGNAGFVLRANYDNPAAKGIYSSEFSTSSYRPYVAVTYDTDIWLNKNVANVVVGSGTTLTANSTQSGATVTWTSSDTSVATVSSTGSNTCRVTTVSYGVATITARLSTGQTDSCQVYVYMSNGVYYLRCGSNLYLSVDGGMVAGSTVTLQTKKTTETDRMRQLWKFEYLGQHYYSIRALYRPDLALIATDDGVVEMATLSTSLSGNSIPMNRRWTISRSGSYYSFEYTGTSTFSLQPKPGSIAPGTSVIADMASGSSRIWSIDSDSSCGNQVLLINTKTGLPDTNAAREITLGSWATPADLNLMAVFVCLYTNYQNIQWSSASPSIATVDQSTGKVTGVSLGQTTITASYMHNGSNHTTSYTLTVKSPYGQIAQLENRFYRLRNSASTLYLDIHGPDAQQFVHQWSYHTDPQEIWLLQKQSDGYYTIRSQFGDHLFVGISNSSIDQNNVRLFPEITDATRWKIYVTNDGKYIFEPKNAPGKALCAPNNIEGAEMQLTSILSDGNKQKWIISAFTYSGKTFSAFDIGDSSEDEVSIVETFFEQNGYTDIGTYRNTENSISGQLFVDVSRYSDIVYVNGHGGLHANLKIQNSEGALKGWICADNSVNTGDDLPKTGIGAQWKNGSNTITNSSWNLGTKWVILAQCDQFNFGSSEGAGNHWNGMNSGQVWLRTMLGDGERLHGMVGYFNRAPGGETHVIKLRQFLANLNTMTIADAWREAHYNQLIDVDWAVMYHQENGNDRIDAFTESTPTNATPNIVLMRRESPATAHGNVAANVYANNYPILVDTQDGTKANQIYANLRDKLPMGNNCSLELEENNRIVYHNHNNHTGEEGLGMNLSDEEAVSYAIQQLEKLNLTPTGEFRTSVSYVRKYRVNPNSGALENAETIEYTVRFYRTYNGIDLLSDQEDGIIVSFNKYGLTELMHHWRELKVVESSKTFSAAITEQQALSICEDVVTECDNVTNCACCSTDSKCSTGVAYVQVGNEVKPVWICTLNGETVLVDMSSGEHIELY